MGARKRDWSHFSGALRLPCGVSGLGEGPEDCERRRIRTGEAADCRSDQQQTGVHPVAPQDAVRGVGTDVPHHEMDGRRALTTASLGTGQSPRTPSSACRRRSAALRRRRCPGVSGVAQRSANLVDRAGCGQGVFATTWQPDVSPGRRPGERATNEGSSPNGAARHHARDHRVGPLGLGNRLRASGVPGRWPGLASLRPVGPADPTRVAVTPCSRAFRTCRDGNTRPGTIGSARWASGTG